MEPKNFIAIDLGATSGRVILATLDGEKINMETINRFPTPLLEIEGKFYWNIYSIYSSILEGLKIVGGRGVKVESIGVDTWGVDVVGIAPDGSLCGLPRSYRDPYTDGIQDEFYKKMSRADLYDRTGIQTMDFNTVFQLFALKRDGAFVHKRASKFVFMPDAISYLLTGKIVCEYTILSTSALMNPRTKKFDKKILKVAGVKKSQFGSIVMPGTTIGTLSESVARQTGLDGVSVVAVAGHDTASAVASVPAADKNFAYLSSGTWSLMGIESPQPVIDEKMAALNYTNEGGVDGTTRLLKNITGMWILEQCLKVWREEGKEYSYAEIARMASECKPSVNYIDPDDKCFAAPTNMPKTIREYCEKKGYKIPEDDAHMMRLIYDSLAWKYSYVFQDLRGFSENPLNVLHIIGGGSQNEFLDQLTADACKVTVVAGPAEGTALGNVMVQARTAGVVNNLQESRDYIRRSIETKVFNPNL